MLKLHNIWLYSPLVQEPGGKTYFWFFKGGWDSSAVYGETWVFDTAVPVKSMIERADTKERNTNQNILHPICGNIGLNV